MNMKEIKQVRGQLRQITKDVLPEVLTQELADNLYKRIVKNVGERLQVIHDDIKKRLDAVDERSKDVQNMMIREIMSNVQVRENAEAFAKTQEKPANEELTPAAEEPKSE